MDSEEIIRKFEIRKEENPLLERISSEFDLENSFPLQSLNPSSQRDTELLSVLFTNSSKNSQKTQKPQKPQKTQKKSKNPISSEKTLQKGFISVRSLPKAPSPHLFFSEIPSKSQRNQEFLARIQRFISKKKQFILNEQLTERNSHFPLLTYKGYMSKSKSIDELSYNYGNNEKKQAFLKKIIEENERKCGENEVFKPKTNENHKKSSKLGLDLKVGDYIKRIQKENEGRNVEILKENKKSK